MSIEEIHDRYVDVTEFARVVGIHPQTAQRLVAEGRVPVVKPRVFGGRKHMIERTVMEYWQANYDPRPGRKAYPGAAPQ